MKEKYGNIIEHTAYHEAGHVVAEYALGRYVSRVTIVPDEDAGIAATYDGQGLSIDGSGDEDDIVVFYSGEAAQRRFDPATGDAGCGSDIEAAAAILGDRSEADLRKRADELVSKHWSKVEAVASMLLEEKTVLGADLDIIYSAIEAGVDWRQDLVTMRHLRGSGGEGQEQGIDPDEN